MELFFNFGGIVDNVLISLMYDILDDMRNDRHTQAKEQLFCNHLRIYLKVEWNRVKDEAEGKKYTKEKSLSELCSAYKSYLEDKPQISGVKSIEKVRDFLEDYKK